MHAGRDVRASLCELRTEVRFRGDLWGMYTGFRGTFKEYAISLVQGSYENWVRLADQWVRIQSVRVPFWDKHACSCSAAHWVCTDICMYVCM